MKPIKRNLEKINFLKKPSLDNKKREIRQHKDLALKLMRAFPNKFKV